MQLCGRRYGRLNGKTAHRWGKTKGTIDFHGGKIEVERPRVRARSGGEVALPSWEAAPTEDWLSQWTMNLMLINVSTRKFGRAVRLPGGDIPAANGFRRLKAHRQLPFLKSALAAHGASHSVNPALEQQSAAA
jgi:hypothetical protein